MSDEAPIVVTLKVEGGPASPWIVLRSNDPNQAQQQLDAIAASGLADAIGRAHAAVNAGFNAGNVLGARLENAPVARQQAPVQQPTAAQNANDPAWGAPQDQPAWSQPQQQPAQQYAQAAANGYQQQAPQQQYQQQQAAPVVPGAPIICGQPAKLIQSKPGAPRPWSAWADPRPKEVTQNLTKTDDPNDPRLAQGLATFWAFIR